MNDSQNRKKSHTFIILCFTGFWASYFHIFHEFWNEYFGIWAQKTMTKKFYIRFTEKELYIYRIVPEHGNSIVNT